MSIRDLLRRLFGPRPDPTPPPTPPLPAPDPDPAPPLLDSALVLAEINRARLARRRPALVPDDRLTAVARAHAADMARRGRMDHRDFAGRLDRSGFPHSAAAEVVAAGQRDAAECVAGWMASPGHRANLLGPCTHAGAGVAADARGTRYWCAAFARPA